MSITNAKYSVATNIQFLVFSLISISLIGTSVAQSSAQPAAKADYSQEAFVIEQTSSKQKFENDGTSSREETARVRIQSEAGLQQYGLLTFSYASATGTFEIGYVRVRKPDGTVIETPADSIQDMAAQITREAPFYSDLHEKHVAVKGLSVGDVLEFQTTEHTTKPLAAGQFWSSFRFSREQIVLDEQLEISVPRDRSVKIKNATVQPVISESGGYRIYTWHSKSLDHGDETNKKKKGTETLWQQVRGRIPQPDVLMSSFSSWEDVGRWYSGLQDERVKPSAEVVAKAAELTRNAPDEETKLRTLYAYVSTQFRYIGIDFGIGRYQPHSAADVLANQFGDCKDKHTLLASLLTASGIPAYPALISTTREVDADVPSPGQFNHVITVVPRDGKLVWLDTTAEVGPYQFLVSSLRDKHALVAWGNKSPALEITPADLPYGSNQSFNLVGKLNDAGTLEGRVNFTSRGDIEFILRNGFRSVPLPQWKDLGQRIAQSFGFSGEVTEVVAGSPEKTDEPFHFSYKYTRKELGDWPNRQIVAPLPIISMPAPVDDEFLPPGPLWLGPPLDVDCLSEMELPRGYRPTLPAAIHLKQDFAQFDATYDFNDGKLISERRFKTLLREVPESEREQYKQFMKKVLEDYVSFIPLSSGDAPRISESTEVRQLPTMRALQDLPDSPNTEAARLENEAREALRKNDAQTATSSLYRAVSADPKFTRAWLVLGTLLLGRKQIDAGIDAFQKGMIADPDEPAIPKALGWSLMAASEFQQAVSVWQQFVKTHPNDPDGPANLGNCLSRLQRYSEAAAAYEDALKIGENKPALQAKVGSTYLLAGDRDKAGVAFGRLGDLDPQALTLNDVAYEMAQSDLRLPLALEYAQKAVRTAEEESQKITLPDLTVEDLARINTLAAYWDTLGWVNERMSNLGAAEDYLRASWKLTQDGTVASHLCNVYERDHKVALAIQMCSLALDRLPMSQGLSLSTADAEMKETKLRLKHLTESTEKSKSTVDAPGIVVQERTFKLSRFLQGSASAEFFVLMQSDGTADTFKVEDIKFISGSDKMKLQGKQLKAIQFNFPVPGNAHTRFVRRGILGCYQFTGCSFVLLDPASAKSLD